MGALLCWAVFPGIPADGDNMLTGFAGALRFMAFFVAVCIVLGLLLRHQAARPFTSLIDRVYFGGSPVDEPPPLNLRLAVAYRAEHCYERAIEECERQLEHHPLVPELWAELVLANRGAGNRAGEAAALQSALERLGMTRVPTRFVNILLARDNLPAFKAGLHSQFER